MPTGGDLRTTDKRETGWKRNTTEKEENDCLDKREIGPNEMRECEMPTVDDLRSADKRETGSERDTTESEESACMDKRETGWSEILRSQKKTHAWINARYDNARCKRWTIYDQWINARQTRSEIRWSQKYT